MAKVKYFRTNIDHFEPLKYDYKKGFVTVPLWDSDFLRHRASRYILDYIFDCIFAGIHFSFSGYFCACGKSGLSFLHNILAIALVRIPGVCLTSQMFPTTLFPMSLATAAGSLLSVMICIIAFAVIRHKNRQIPLGV